MNGKRTDEMLKAAVLILGEEIYPRDFLDGAIESVMTALEDMDVEIAAKYIIMNDADGLCAERDLKGRDVDLIITAFVSWHITPNVMHALKHFRDIPILVLGVGGRTDANGKLVSPAAAAGVTAFVPVLREMGYKYKVICGKPDEPLRADQVKSYLRAVNAAKKVRNARVGLIGYADMGLYTCAYDKTLVFDKLGIDIENYFSYEITGRMASAPEDEIRSIISGIKERMEFENEITDVTLEKTARLYYAMKFQSETRRLNAISIKCVTGVTAFMGFNPCMAQSLLASNELSVICECDAYGLLTNVILTALTGQASAFMENYEVFDDAVLVGVCGFIPKDFTEGCERIRSANLGEAFKGISNVSRVKTGTVTFGRLYQSDGRLKMFVSRGEACKSPKWTELGWAEPTPDFPSILLKLEMPVQSYLENVPGQHIIMVYGDWLAELKQLCGLLNIEVAE